MTFVEKLESRFDPSAVFRYKAHGPRVTGSAPVWDKQSAT